MIVEIKTDIFNSIDNFKQFNYLLQILTNKRRYDLFIDIEELINNPVFDRIDIDDKTIIEEYFDRQIQENKKIDYSVSQNSSFGFNLEEAIRFFENPVLIVLENDFNDAYFINALIKNFNKQNIKIKNIEMKNGYVIEMVAVLEIYLTHFVLF